MALQTLHRLLAALVAALALLGCTPQAVLPPAPIPAPGPVEPAAGHVVTEAEFEAVALGTAEAEIMARFGPPVRVVVLAEEQARSYVYRATTAADPTRTAGFWVRDGVVVNRVLY